MTLPNSNGLLIEESSYFVRIIRFSVLGENSWDCDEYRITCLKTLSTNDSNYESNTYVMLHNKTRNSLEYMCLYFNSFYEN